VLRLLAASCGASSGPGVMEFDAPRLQKKAGTGTLYSIDVPVDSSVNLVTHIEAVETGVLGSLPWWLWLLVTLVVVVVAASRFMRSRRTPQS